MTKIDRLSKSTLTLKLDSQSVKAKELSCSWCTFSTKNKLAFILHLELFHKHEILITKY